MQPNRFEINTFEELKCISDQLRMKISMLLIEREMTATEIGKHLNIPKAKIFYHLKELERYGMVKINRTEVKGSNVYKYYVATHNGFKVNPQLLNEYRDEVSDSTKDMVTSQINRTIDVLNQYGLIMDDEQLISKTVQAKWSQNQFDTFKQKLDALIDEVDQQSNDEDKSYYYLNIIGFEMRDKVFNRKENDD
ncbi:winged helix-turn-helix domain-containing protein [Mammaliicoccus sciuri]|uniref:ArsR/SmtB family transcription factor n=1 Tax=Mammaliicoccus TaxID=2803850 RepID=UPI0007344499|nr:winged helix-turn-helix domain-containing protein [Mammaliicoccus sciuri]MBO3081089.1 winged helix-turn-helix transcriptional regulator [Mammaliicoccus sciuri]MCD8778116.1 winged helix-turn-helix domain-containing protein [Mammaliicoccus sciuri]MCD8779570.1 winged helix-turn-helix domain-containing protein [Mammaliicoccus sciuri]MCD8788692.1 winged helix-turn-helix domain-containing protein [Mammaliicoccus sciuri]MCD8801394.1 winged helix-turn-helix domain-containing protein [Mammaliicoccus